MLSRLETRPRVLVWPIQLEEPLPAVNVPLRQPDGDVLLDLESALTTVYDNGAYDVQLDYRKPVTFPALTKAQPAWVDQLLHQAS